MILPDPSNETFERPSANLTFLSLKIDRKTAELNFHSGSHRTLLLQPTTKLESLAEPLGSVFGGMSGHIK